MLYVGALPSAFCLRDLLKQAFVSFSHYLGMETQMRSCDTTNSVCPQGLSQVASLCADKIMKFANGTRTAGYVSYCSMDWAMLCSYKLIICWVIPLCFGLWFLVLYCYVKETWAKAKEQGTNTKGHGSRTKEQGTNTKEQGPRAKEQGTRHKDYGKRSKDQRPRDKEQLFCFVRDTLKHVWCMKDRLVG